MGSLHRLKDEVLDDALKLDSPVGKPSWKAIGTALRGDRSLGLEKSKVLWFQHLSVFNQKGPLNGVAKLPDIAPSRMGKKNLLGLL